MGESHPREFDAEYQGMSTWGEIKEDFGGKLKTKIIGTTQRVTAIRGNLAKSPKEKKKRAVDYL